MSTSATDIQKITWSRKVFYLPSPPSECYSIQSVLKPLCDVIKTLAKTPRLNVFGRIYDELSNPVWLEKCSYLLPSFQQEFTIRNVLMNAIKLTIWAFFLISLSGAFGKITLKNICLVFVSILIILSLLKYCFLDLNDEQMSVDGETDNGCFGNKFDIDKEKQRELEILISNFNCRLSNSMIIDEKEE